MSRIWALNRVDQPYAALSKHFDKVSCRSSAGMRAARHSARIRGPLSGESRPDPDRL
jgi:hypothetical protein